MTTTPRPGCELPPTIPLYIVAGGRSRRFGADKARALVDGVPMIRRVADVLAGIAQTTTVVARGADAYQDLGFTTIADAIADRGPAGGIMTALGHNRESRRTADWVFVSACDWQGIDVKWARELMGQRGRGAHAIVFETQRLEPLFALYHRSAEAPIASCVRRGNVAMQRVLRTLDAVILPAPPGWRHATNVNVREDLEPGGKGQA